MKTDYDKAYPTQLFLTESFEYRERDDYANLYWRFDRPLHHFADELAHKIYLRERAGVKLRKPMCVIQGVSYRNDMLIFIYHHGYKPDGLLFIDKNVKNHRIENLKPLTLEG